MYREWIEALDLCRDRRGEARRIKMRDGRNAALAGQQVSPSLLRADSNRAHQSHTCNDNSTRQTLLLPRKLAWAGQFFEGLT